MSTLQRALVLSLFAVPTALAGPPAKTDVCHYDANTGLYTLLSLGGQGASAHLLHHADVLPSAWYLDTDGDGFGDTGAVDSCPQPGLVDNPDDCDDGDIGVNPGAPEVCGDGVDNNCDGQVDEGCVVDCGCFTAADLDAAYAQISLISQDYPDYYETCHNGYGHSPEESGFLVFRAYDYDGITGTSDNVGYLYLLDGRDAQVESHSCSMQRVDWSTHADSPRQQSTQSQYSLDGHAEYEACMTVLMDWTIANGLDTCTSGYRL